MGRTRSPPRRPRARDYEPAACASLGTATSAATQSSTGTAASAGATGASSAAAATCARSPCAALATLRAAAGRKATGAAEPILPAAVLATTLGERASSAGVAAFFGGERRVGLRVEHAPCPKQENEERGSQAKHRRQHNVHSSCRTEFLIFRAIRSRSALRAAQRGTVIETIAR